MKSAKASLLIAIGGMITFWALTPVTIAYVKEDFSLTFQIWLRYLCSAAALWVYILLNKSTRNNLRIIIRRAGYFIPRMIVTALCTVSFQLFYTRCFFLIQPAFGTLLTQSQVLFSVLTGAIFIQSERALLSSKATVGGIILAVSGAAAVILFQSGGIEVTINAGVLMALLAACSWSFVGLTNRLWLAEHLPPILSVTVVFSFVAVFMTPLAFLSGNPVSGDPEGFKWVVLIGSGLLGIAGGQGLYYYLVPRIGLITAASVQLLIPFITGILSFLIFKERFSLLQLIGGIILLAGCRIILARRAAVQDT